MVLSRLAIVSMCILLILSVFCAKFLSSIAIDDELYIHSLQNYSLEIGAKYSKITDKSENIIWFLQITDIHISIFRDPGRINDFKEFCDITVKTVKPSVVLASGDLTDAKAKDNLGSAQVKSEWKHYYHTIKDTGVDQYTTWLDIRGNHDNFNIGSLNSEENYFRNYSVQGQNNPRSYVHYINQNGVNAAFLGVDACPEPGLRRPFNFIGLVSPKEQKHVRELRIEAEANADHIVWYGHYPTSCVVWLADDPAVPSFRTEMGASKKTNSYLCGHLHSMGGLVPKMYTLHRDGYLELELSDWKDNRRFRIGSLDHGLLSFTDEKHGDWPIILVTNPKDAQFVLSGREPIHLMKTSSHVRILVFSDADIEEVTISFDGMKSVKCKVSKRPLYVCKWNPRLYATGIHKLYVNATDKNGRVKTLTHQFSLDGSKRSFDLSPRIFLMLDADKVFQGAFGTMLVISIIPLVILRHQKKAPKQRRVITGKVMRRLWLLSKVDRLFYPIVLYAAYLPIGPWSVGILIDGYWGAIFAWGIVIGGSFLPESFTYAYGTIQLIFVQIPLTLVLAWCVEKRVNGGRVRGVKKIVSNTPFIVLLSVQLLLAYYFWLEYGTIAFLFGPLRTWGVALSAILWYKSLTLPPEYCRKLTKLLEEGACS